MSAGTPRFFAAFWSWWWPAIITWLPTAMRQRLFPVRPCQTVTWDGLTFDPPIPVAQAVDTVILLPPQQTLIRSLRLPVAALGRLRDVVGFEVERQTPFAVDQVHFDAVLTKVPAKGVPMVDVLLIVTPKAVVEGIRSEASGLLPQLIRIDVPGTNGEPLGANLLPDALRFRPPAKWRKWNIALACILLIAAFGLLLGLLRAREDAVARLEEQARPILSSALRVQQRRNALASMQVRMHQTGTGATSSVSALQIVSEVSARLPKDTYLLQLRLNRPIVSVRGRTENLSAMLEGLNKSSLWGDPKLTGSRALPERKAEEFSLDLLVQERNAGG